MSWPVEVGPVPALASAFQARELLRAQIDGARAGTGSVVLTQVLSGGGGVGKTQLAAACAIDALKTGAEVVVWATATEVQQVITQYAQAAARLHLPRVSGQEREADARALLDWLATTSHRWLVILDDITDPTMINSWWPVSRTGTGWVLATTRLKDARLTGSGRTRVDIDVYTADEAHAYLCTRLTDDGMGYLLDDHTPALAEALGHLPLALSLAAAFMINEELSCTAYLRRFNHHRTRLEEALPETADTEGYGRQITAALLLCLDAVQSTDTTGLAQTVLRLAALLDPAGHPHALWTTPSLLDHLALHRKPNNTEHAPQVTADQTHAALRLLHRYALLTCDTRAEPRAVRIHALTARAVRENTAAASTLELATATADALLNTWPEIDQPHLDLAAALRTNTEVLTRHTHDHLRHPQGHPVLYRAGISLLDAGLPSTAISYWHDMAKNTERVLGAHHPETITTRGNLANAYFQAGRISEAIDLHERVLAAFEQLLGADHSHTLTARGGLATAYSQAGRISEAIEIEERVLADRERLFGVDHPETLTARNNLATSYREAGRTDEAIEMQERAVVDRERLLDADHPDTLLARGNLASAFMQAGRISEAIELQERVLADHERLLGAGHPHTLTTRGNLATCYWLMGRTVEAATLHAGVLADREQLLGADHPDTLTARNNLASAYWQMGRMKEATGLQEGVLADHERLLGADHPDTLAARNNLATIFWHAGRIDEAVDLLKRVSADSQRVLGADHPNTLATRGNLTNALQQLKDGGISA
ncbi:tetratricopeptide repeat protein [Streptomyces tauricus]|nr:tetratricopeptide repeat protein [Streptomyces tauricus]